MFLKNTKKENYFTNIKKMRKEKEKKAAKKEKIYKEEKHE